MKRHVAAFLVVLGLVLAFQIWFLGLGPGGIKLGDPSLSTLYTEALAHGQSYLRDTPDPAHPLLDTSLYHGRHYMYFGIVPFVLFMVPGYFLTGSSPSPEAAVLFFCCLGYLAYGYALLHLINRSARSRSIVFTAAAFAILVLCSGTWPLMGRPAIYEIENAAAYAFLGLAILGLFLLEFGRGPKPILRAATAAAAALTLGCRPNYVPAVSIVVAWLLWGAVREGNSARERAWKAAWIVTPLAVVGGLLAGWNVHRFGDPLDFGLRHTVSEQFAKEHPLARAAYFPLGAYRYAVGGAHVSRYFPFIQGPSEAPLRPVGFQEQANQVYGFLFLTPALVFALAAYGGSKGETPRLEPRLITVLFGCFLGNFVFLSSIAMSCYRYPADFLGPLAILAALGVLRAGGLRSVGSRLGLGFLLAALLLWTAAAVTFQTFSTAQITELFDRRRQRDFERVAGFFDACVYSYEAWAGDGPRAWALTVKLPSDRFGTSEPLLVDGPRGAQDFLYVYYVRAGVLQLGFESTGLGGIRSRFVDVDYAKHHTIEIRYGSFLPPDDHPWMRQRTPQDRALLRRMITVLLDGTPIIDGWADFHPARARFQIGRSADDPAFGSRFTGSLLAVAKPILSADLSPARWVPANYGPLRVSAAPIPMPKGVYDPLVSIGNPGQCAQLLLEHLDGSNVRIRWVTSSGQDRSSSTFGWPAGEKRQIVLRTGALYPPVGSSVWPENATRAFQESAKASTTVSIGGVVVLHVSTPPLDAAPSTVEAGFDRLVLAASVMPAFSGTIGSPQREPWQP